MKKSRPKILEEVHLESKPETNPDPDPDPDPDPNPEPEPGLIPTLVYIEHEKSSGPETSKEGNRRGGGFGLMKMY